MKSISFFDWFPIPTTVSNLDSTRRSHLKETVEEGPITVVPWYVRVDRWILLKLIETHTHRHTHIHFGKNQQLKLSTTKVWIFRTTGWKVVIERGARHRST